jgi:hypothetical protein
VQVDLEKDIRAGMQAKRIHLVFHEDNSFEEHRTSINETEQTKTSE